MDQTPKTNEGPTHTPGPWTFGQAYPAGNFSVAWGAKDGRRTLADVYFKSYAPGGDNFGFRAEPAEANARLMAAAPDLLAALESLVAFQEDDSPVTSALATLNQMDEIDERIRAAIAKAKGQS